MGFVSVIDGGGGMGRVVELRGLWIDWKGGVGVPREVLCGGYDGGYIDFREEIIGLEMISRFIYRGDILHRGAYRTGLTERGRLGCKDGSCMDDMGGVHNLGGRGLGVERDLWREGGGEF